MTDNQQPTEHIVETIESTSANAIALYAGGLEDTLTRIARELKDFTPDISTKKGRDEIKSRAYKASQCKSRLDDMGKELNADAQAKIDAVNADRKKAKEFLDTLRDEIRKPVDDWEQEEKSRLKIHEDNIVMLGEFDRWAGDKTSTGIEAGLHNLNKFWSDKNWEEFAMKAERIARETFDKMKDAIEKAKQDEADKAELAKLRAEQAKRDEEDRIRQQKERDEQIARDAAEAARIAAEAEAARKAKEVEDAAAVALAAEKEATERAVREAADAERRAQEASAAAAKAESDRIAAAEAAETARIAAEKKAADDHAAAMARAEAARLAAAEQARLDREAAVEAERKRQADAKAAEDEAARLRQEDLENRKKINNEILNALIKMDCLLGEIPCKALITAIAKGEIPHVGIRY